MSNPFSRFVSAGKILLLLALGMALTAPLSHADNFTATVKDSDDSSESKPRSESADTSSSSTDNESISTQKAADTPHFWQRDDRGGFENGGRDYCCPVAVSDSFVYFARHGFPDLLGEGDGAKPQIDLINEFASSDYFGTDPDNGTAPGAVLSGVRKYVEDQGYHCARLEYEGWRKVGRNQQDAVKADRPSLDWLKDGIRDPHGAVWLNVGWYKRGDAAGTWKRTGGHWVTLVGYGATEPGGTADPNLLLVHNSLIRGSDDTPDDPAKDVVHLRQVSEGTLDTGKGSTQDAAGMYQVSGPGLPMGNSVYAFLDAAIVFVIRK